MTLGNGTPASNGHFERCNAQNPCPICGGTQWCQMIGDSTIQCMKVAQGSYKTVEQVDGAIAYLHRIGSNGIPNSYPAQAPTERATIEFMDRVYKSVVDSLTLPSTGPCREGLRRRGFTDEQIDRLAYRDFPSGPPRWQIARTLYQQYGADVLRVPGFVIRDQGKGPYATIAGPDGLLIPVRNRHGQITALKVRRDDEAIAADPRSKNRYQYLTSHSKKWPGPKAIDGLHVPLGTDLSGSRLRVTEGPLKADRCSVGNDIPTVALQSAGAWRHAAALLKEMPNIRELHLAPDSDFRTNQQVARGSRELFNAAVQLGRELRLETWDPELAKGIDDALNAGIEITVLCGEEARMAIEAASGNSGTCKTRVSPPNSSGVASALERPIDGTVNKAVDDPCELSRQFLSSRYRHTTGELTLHYHLENWHRWDGAAWPELPEDQVCADLVSFIESVFDRHNQQQMASYDPEDSKPAPVAKKVTVRLVNDVLQALLAQSIVPADITAPSWINGASGPNLYDCLFARNGIVDLRALTAGNLDYMKSATPNLFNNTALPFDFSLTAPAPLQWLNFLQGIWPDEPECILLLQEWFGYCITPDTRMQKIFMIVGPGRSGKGTIARILTGLVGVENTAAPTLGSFAERFGLWPLVGKTLAVVGDAHLSGRADAAIITERLKSISGEDLQTIDRKNRQPISAKLPDAHHDFEQRSPQALRRFRRHRKPIANAANDCVPPRQRGLGTRKEAHD